MKALNVGGLSLVTKLDGALVHPQDFHTDESQIPR